MESPPRNPGKRAIGESSEERAPKKAETEETRAALDTAIVPRDPAKEPPPEAPKTESESELVIREQRRITLELNPQYLEHLKRRNEVGFVMPAGKKGRPLKTFEIDTAELRRSIEHVFRAVLQVRYQADASMRQTEIAAEIDDIAPLTASVVMTALYSKLRSIHKAFGKHASRYTSAPSYTRDVEIPLPFALAIQEFGSFETHSVEDRSVYAPTYPEGTQHEGRASAEYQLTEYLSYLPTLKSLGLHCKSIDPRSKSGSAWWTYKIKNTHGTSDLLCTLPPSHYSDQSAILRSIFMAPTAADTKKVSDIVKMPNDSPSYGTRLREMPPGSNIRSFLALSQGPEEEWSYGAS